MSFTVTKKSLPASVVIENQHTWPLEVIVTSTEGSHPAEIFVYKRGQEGQAAFAGDVFECVASVHNMAEYGLQPTLLPDGGMVPYFRTNRLIFHCRTPEEANDLWTDVLEDIRELLRQAAALSELTTEVSVTL